MFQYQFPDTDTIERFLATQRSQKFSYCHQGKTATGPPEGFQVDHTRVRLGHGEQVFRAAKDALRNWQQFELGWVSARPNTTEIREGETVCVIGHAGGFYWLNACRIVYVVDEDQPHRRFGFAYGTLPGHMEMGEERFLVEIDPAGDVWYEILAFSRPKRWIVWAVYPYMRSLQKRFAHHSAARMKRIVGESVATAA